MADKKIKLYKVKEDGTLDKDTQLLPETSMEAVSGLGTALSGKQASLTETQLNAVNSGITSDKVSQYDGYDNSKVSKTDLVKDLTYDIIEKEIPGEIVDGETYELSMEYDMSKFDLPSESEPPLVLYGDLGNIPFILIYFQGIGYNDDENGYSYMDIGDGYHWYIMGDEPILYEGEPLTITIDESRINEDKKDILSIILGIQPTIVTVNQTVEEKNEDLQNWPYEKQSYHIKKVNFDVTSYKQYFTPQFNNYIYSNSTNEQDVYLSYGSNNYPTFYLSVKIDNTYKSFYFIYNLNSEKYGSWQNSSYQGTDYTDEELEQLTFTYKNEGLNTADETCAIILKTILLNEDGTAVTELIEGNNYKINPNVEEYRNVFDSIDDLLKKSTYYVYRYTDSSWDSNVKQIDITTVGYSYATYFSISNIVNAGESKTNKYYYFLPRISESLYPGIWADNSGYGTYHIYTEEELADVQIASIDESKINNQEMFDLIVINEEKFNIVKLNEKINSIENELLKNKVYDYIESNIPVDGHTYKLKENANINSLLSDEGSSVNLLLYGNESYRIEYIKSSSKGGSTEYNLNVYDSNDDIIDIYIIALGAGGQHYVNQWQNGTDVLTLDFLYNEQNINPLYKDYFNQFLDVQESSSRSLEQKFNEVENAPLKDKTYEQLELTDGNSYKISKVIDIDSTTSDTTVYEDNSQQTEGKINQILISGGYLLVFTVPPIGAISSPYAYELSSKQWVDGEYEDIPLLDYNSSADTINEELLAKVLELSITLDEKLNEIEPPYTITDYTEDNGALTSITVKDKTDGTETQLTIGGGKKEYQHNICLVQKTQVTEYNLYCTIISDRATAYDFTSLTSYLQEQVPQSYGIVLSGKAYYQNDNVVAKFATRIYYSNNQKAIRIEYINTQWALEYKPLDGTIIDNVKPK